MRYLVLYNSSQSAVKAIKHMSRTLRDDDHVVVFGVLEHQKPESALETKRELTVALSDAALSLRESAHLPADHVQAVCVESDDVRRAAMDAVQEHNADVIVCGTRNNSHLKRLLVGSLAQFLIESAICPVLVVRGDVMAAPEADDDEKVTPSLS